MGTDAVFTVHLMILYAIASSFDVFFMVKGIYLFYDKYERFDLACSIFSKAQHYPVIAKSQAF